MDGIKNKVKMVDVIIPPMVTIAIGVRNSAPASPIPSALGNIPKIIATVVIITVFIFVLPAVIVAS